MEREIQWKENIENKIDIVLYLYIKREEIGILNFATLVHFRLKMLGKIFIRKLRNFYIILPSSGFKISF